MHMQYLVVCLIMVVWLGTVSIGSISCQPDTWYLLGVSYSERFIHYRKYVLHLRKPMFHVRLSRCSTDSR